jgi:tartrate dehydrogenase/decarboxylase/D-malate dehydrogenase
MTAYNIAAIPGHGIGREVVPAGMWVMDAAGDRFGFQLRWEVFDWSGDRYLETGGMMPDDGLSQLQKFDAIFQGAIGDPRVAEHVSLCSLLIPIRRAFRQHIICGASAFSRA